MISTNQGRAGWGGWGGAASVAEAAHGGIETARDFDRVRAAHVYERRAAVRLAGHDVGR
jgi:hypothetical protein